MSKFINLPNGISLRSDTIRAVRSGEPRAKGAADYEIELKPRVIIDFVIGERGNSVAIDCVTIEERNELHDFIMRLLNAQSY